MNQSLLRSSFLLTAALVLASLAPARADVIYSTIPAWNAASQPLIGELGSGDPNCSTCTAIGQTFVAPAGGLSLNSFSFELAPSSNVFRLELTPYVFAWNGNAVPGTLGSIAGATGPNLLPVTRVDFACGSCDNFAPMGTTIFNGSTSGFTQVTVNVAALGGLNLVAGQTYVLGFTSTDPTPSSTNSESSINWAAVGAIVSSPNNGGGAGQFPNLGNSYSSLTSQDWWDYQLVSNGNNGTTYAKTDPVNGNLAYTADFGAAPTELTLAGNISPSTEDLQYKDLVYSVTDGSNTYSGELLLNGSCTAGTTCAFSDSLYIAANAGFTPTSITYTILGLYGDTAPYPCNIDGTPCTVTANPDVFALTNSSLTAGSDFSVFWDTLDGYGTGSALEDAVSTALENGDTLASQGLLPGAGDQYLVSSAPGTSLSGSVYDFSDATLNGSFDLSGSIGSSAPEPAGLGILAGLMILLMSLRRRSSGFAGGLSWLNGK